MKIKYDLWLFVFGVAMVALGVVLWQGHISEAASQTYSENYTVSKWRNLKDTKVATATEYSVGASEWTVTGSVGTTSYSETWKATNWKDQIVTTDSYASSSIMSFIDSATYKTDVNMAGCNHAETLACQTRGNGDYGVLLWDVPGKTLGSAKSIPWKWEVTGTVNTP